MKNFEREEIEQELEKKSCLELKIDTFFLRATGIYSANMYRASIMCINMQMCIPVDIVILPFGLSKEIKGAAKIWQFSVKNYFKRQKLKT